MLRRNGPVVKSVESVLRLEGSLWWERFVKEVVSFSCVNVEMSKAVFTSAKEVAFSSLFVCVSVC